MAWRANRKTGSSGSHSASVVPTTRPSAPDMDACTGTDTHTQTGSNYTQLLIGSTQTATVLDLESLHQPHATYHAEQRLTASGQEQVLDSHSMASKVPSGGQSLSAPERAVRLSGAQTSSARHWQCLTGA